MEGITEQRIAQQVTLSVISSCFDSCVTSFREDKMTPKEVGCVQNCAHRESSSMRSVEEIQGKLMGGSQGGF